MVEEGRGDTDTSIRSILTIVLIPTLQEHIARARTQARETAGMAAGIIESLVVRSSCPLDLPDERCR